MFLNYRNRAPKFLHYPHPILSSVASPVDFSTTTHEDRMKIVRSMNSALTAIEWGSKLGIAAPQIGISKCVMIVRGSVMFNPTWHPTNAPEDTFVEGCYSSPHKLYKVSRASSGWGEWTDINGEWKKYKLNGLSAIVFQHEINHLNGICIADIGEEIQNNEASSNLIKKQQENGKI